MSLHGTATNWPGWSRFSAARPYPSGPADLEMATTMWRRSCASVARSTARAIELAAGQLRSLSFADLAARLGHQLTALARHRTMGSAPHARYRAIWSVGPRRPTGTGMSSTGPHAVLRCHPVALSTV